MTLEELLVRIKVENKQAVKGLDEAKKAAEQAESRFDKLQGGLKNLKAQMKTRSDNTYAKEVSKGYKDAQKSLDGLLKKQEAMKRRNTASPQYKKLTSDIAKAERALDGLVERQVAWAESGIDPSSSPFQALDAQIESARARLDLLYEKQKDMASNGSTKAEAEEWSKIRGQIERARGEVAKYEKILAGVGAGNPAIQRITKFVSSIRRAGSGVKKFAATSRSAFKSVTGWITRMGRGFGKVLSKIPLLGNMTKQIKGMRRGLFTGLGAKGLLRMGAAGFLLYKALSMAKQGFENLAKYSGQTNSDISMLMGSLNTLKNALATAFAPILTAVAPALNSLIQLLVKAATAVAHFTAAFTGKSTVVVAKQQTADYAAGLNDAADAAGAANEATKEYQKTLLGFDQMNVLNAQDKSSGSGGSGGAGGGAGAGDMFETVDVSSGAKSLVDKIKDSWKKADFTDLGKEIGDKIAGMLDKIPWKTIKNKAYKLGKSIATGFNGLNDSKLWASIGKTLGESVNTVIEALAGFVENFDWKKAGKAFATGVNQFFKTVNWTKLGKTVSNGAKGILDTITGFFTNVDWEAIGKDFVDAIKAVDWAGLIVKGIKLAGSIGSAVLKLLKGAFQSAIDGLSEWITSGKIWEDLLNIGKVTLEVGLKLIGDAWDLIKTVVKGVSKVTFELGGAIITKIKDAVVWLANKFGFGKEDKPTVPENNPPQYQGHDYQGVDMTQTVTIDAKQTDAFKKAHKAYGEIKTGTATKTANGSRTKGFNTLHSQFGSIKNSSATKKGFGARSDGFKTLHSHFLDIKDSSATKSAYGSRSDGFKKLHSQFVDIYNKSATATVYGSLAENFKSAYAKWAKMTKNTNTTVYVDGRAYMAGGGLYRHGHWQPITMAASGGQFTTGQMFVAREAGPELVGRIGSGTAVMNNDQIVASVSKGVYEAVLSAMSMSDSDKSVNVYLQGDAGKIFKVVQREAVQFVNTTGQAPFPA